MDRAANFLVLTSGNCGAIWFASALNLHPQIFAGCGAYHPIESCFRYNLNKDGVALVRASTARSYRFGAHPQRMRQILDEHGLAFDVPPRDYNRLAWFVLDELADLPGSSSYGALGSVHALTATRFDECRRQDPGLLANRDGPGEHDPPPGVTYRSVSPRVRGLPAGSAARGRGCRRLHAVRDLSRHDQGLD
jgi:hypothetical protein